MVGKASHLELVRKAPERWNEWRSRNATVWPDLRGVNLSRASLEKINLENANLLGANLEYAVLQGANLRNANLKDCKLIGIVLNEADLMEANLYNADLREASLGGAGLRYANLTKANLEGARLELATFGHTTLGQTTLARVLGLDKVIHYGPSSIDVATLEATAGALVGDPIAYKEIEVFYRCAGVPEDLRRHYSSKITRVGKWLSCFVSYSHQDERFASYLWEYLQRRGVRCFLDKKEERVGQDILDKVMFEIIAHDRILLACSENSLESSWVAREFEIARKKEKRTRRKIILPLDLDGYLFSEELEGDLVRLLRGRLVGSFVGWQEGLDRFQGEFVKVLSSLRVD